MYNQNKILRVLQLINLLRVSPSKSIRHIAGILESTERTVYRYIDLLHEVGFRVERDDYNRLFIRSSETDMAIPFSKEEISFLQGLLMTVGRESHLRDSILQKLHLESDIHLSADHLFKAHLGKTMEEISNAIKQHKQLWIRKYHSVNSNTISDRLVEPFGFTDNYQNVIAFEVSSGLNKLFHIERISSVDVTSRSFCFSSQHNFEATDAFGFVHSDHQYEVELIMPFGISVLLKEQYPLTSSYLTIDKATGHFLLKLNVFNLKPVARFILGFPDEIQIIGGIELKNYLYQKLSGLGLQELKRN